jgi:glycine/D-amino acid oxidase-like deaminating enzyme
MEKPLKRIVIVGGGTAGWLSACYVASRSRAAGGEPLSVTLIEAPDIPTVGVGEGTWPTMRSTLAEIGIDEDDILLRCDGALKQGSRFDGWITGSSDDSYYHPFTAPPEAKPIDLVAAWREFAPGLPFAFAMSSQPAVCEMQLAPKQSSMAPYAGALNYAYHLDAGKLAAELAKHGVDRLGVTHLRDEVLSAEQSEDGNIEAVVTRSGNRVHGDLFIDCSGQAALLIGGHYGTEWIDRSNILFNDRALVVQLPVDEKSPVQSQTIGAAHKGGWIWDIGLPTRRGIGCVYSSRFLDDAAAESELRNYVARTAGEEQARAISPRALGFRSGHRAEFWRGNCIAIGLSAGFVEPLEASAIVLTELSLRALMDNFPAGAEGLPFHAQRFNDVFRTRWDRIVEFLKLHYLLSKREEPYWRVHRERETAPERLAQLITLWRTQPPSVYDFPLADELFPAASYQYVYYGMGGELPNRLPPANSRTLGQFESIKQRTRSLLSALPPNRGYLQRLHSNVPTVREGRA